MKTWTLAILVGAATAAGVTGAALALDGNDRADGRDGTATTMIARTDAAAEGAERADGDPRTAGRELMQDPDFREDLWRLRGDQQAAMRAWWDEYGDDPASGEARDALDEMRDAHREAMDALLQKYGVEPGTGRGRDAQTLMGDEDFRKELWKLQGEAEAAVRSWWDEYGDDPEGAAAREALQDLRKEQRARLEDLYEKHGVELDARRGIGHGPGVAGGLLGGGLLGGRVDRGGAGGPGTPPPDGVGSATEAATSTSATL